MKANGVPITFLGESKATPHKVHKLEIKHD